MTAGVVDRSEGEITLIDALRIAADTLENRAKELLAERRIVRRRLIEDSLRDRQIEIDHGGCIAGIRALGLEPNESATSVWPANKQPSISALVSGRNAIITAHAGLKSVYNIDEEISDGTESELELRAEMPRIADIILEQLSIAAESGSKAAAIRRHILDAYKTDIHEKTVGMTLYRLLKDQQVRRDGHVWYLVDQNTEPTSPNVIANELQNIELSDLKESTESNQNS